MRVLALNTALAILVLHLYLNSNCMYKVPPFIIDTKTAILFCLHELIHSLCVSHVQVMQNKTRFKTRQKEKENIEEKYLT